MINIIGASHPISKYLIKIVNDKSIINQFSSKINKKEKVFKYDDIYSKISNNDIIISFSNIYTISIIIDKLINKNIVPSKIILLSSTSIYSKVKKKSIDSGVYTSFLQGEENIERISKLENKCQFIILRSTMIWGDRHDKNIDQVFNFLKKYKFFLLSSKSFGLRAPIHYQDMACIINNFLYKEFDKFNIFDVHGKSLVKYKEMIGLIKNSNRNLKFSFFIVIPFWLIKFIIGVFKKFPNNKLTIKIKSILGILIRQSEDLVYYNNDVLEIFSDYEKINFRERLINTYKD